MGVGARGLAPIPTGAVLWEPVSQLTAASGQGWGALSRPPHSKILQRTVHGMLLSTGPVALAMSSLMFQPQLSDCCVPSALPSTSQSLSP